MSGLPEESGASTSQETCIIAGCNRPGLTSRDPNRPRLCKLHRERVHNGTPLDQPIEVQRSRAGRTCRIDGCDRTPTQGDLCQSHYAREWYRRKRGLPPSDGAPIRYQGPRTDWSDLDP